MCVFMPDAFVLICLRIKRTFMIFVSDSKATLVEKSETKSISELVLCKKMHALNFPRSIKKIAPAEEPDCCAPKKMYLEILPHQNQ